MSEMLATPQHVIVSVAESRWGSESAKLGVAERKKVPLLIMNTRNSGLYA